MVHYLKGKPISGDEIGGPNVIHSHKYCTEWYKCLPSSVKLTLTCSNNQHLVSKIVLQMLARHSTSFLVTSYDTQYFPLASSIMLSRMDYDAQKFNFIFQQTFGVSNIQ